MNLNLLSELIGKEVSYIPNDGIVVINRWNKNYTEINKEGTDELIRVFVLTLDSGCIETNEENYVLDYEYISKNKKKILDDIDMSRVNLLLSQLRDIKLGKILS